MAHRCEHLAEGVAGERVAVLGITAELCPECLAEIKRRIETEKRAETPIEVYAREKEEAMTRCKQTRKDKGGKLVPSCGLAAQDGSDFCPRHTFLYNLQVSKEWEEQAQRKLEADELGLNNKGVRTRVGLCQAGYVFTGSSTCKCGKPIEWWRTPKLRSAPYNPMPEETSVALSHYATCPIGHQFRRAS